MNEVRSWTILTHSLVDSTTRQTFAFINGGVEMLINSTCERALTIDHHLIGRALHTLAAVEFISVVALTLTPSILRTVLSTFPYTFVADVRVSVIAYTSSLAPV